MAKERNALKAGIFILISVVLIFAVVLGIKGLTGFQPTRTLTVSFTLADDLGGLRVGDDVRIGGFKVGVVRDIEIVSRKEVKLQAAPAGAGPAGAATAPAAEDQELLRVVFTVPEKYVVREGAKVGIQGTVTGQSWLNFESLGRPDQPALKDAVALVGKPSPFNAFLSAGPSLQAILKQVNEQTVPTLTGVLADARTNTLPRVDGMLDDVRKQTIPAATGVMTDVRTQSIPRVNNILDDVRGQTIPRVNKAAESGDRMMTEIGDVFGEGKGDLKETFANLNSATTSVKEKLPGILEQVTGVMAKVDTAVAGANEALADVKKTVENTRDATGTVKNVLGSNKGKLDGMIASLKTTGDNLKGASSEIRRSPWRLLYKPGKGEMANLNIFDSARNFAEGANDLNDAAQALRDALQSEQKNPEELKRLMERVEKTFANFSDVEKELWEQVKE